MTEQTRHPTSVGPGVDMARLASEIGDLRYDALGAFLGALAAKLAADAAADAGRGRSRLAGRLDAAASAVRRAEAEIAAAWTVCKPFMRGADAGRKP